MSDDASKKPGIRPDSRSLERLTAEISAALEANDDPLDLDWGRIEAAPPRDAGDLPPGAPRRAGIASDDPVMLTVPQRDAASPPSPPPQGAQASDDDGEPRWRRFDLANMEDGLPTMRMLRASDEELGRKNPPRDGERWRRIGALVWLAAALVALLACVVVFATGRKNNPRVTSLPPKELRKGSELPATPAAGVLPERTPPSGSAPIIAPAEVRTPPSATAAVDPMTLPVDDTSSRARAQARPETPPRATLERATLPSSTERGNPCRPPSAHPEPRCTEAIDPLFAATPGY